MPEVFGDAEQFDAWFSLSDEGAKDNVIKKLHTVLRPFMLRRVKKDVAKSLPPKKETKLYIGLTKMQQEWYVSVLRKDSHELNKLGGPEKSRLLNVLMQLRKVCNHPYLFDGAEEGPPCKFENTIDKCCISCLVSLMTKILTSNCVFGIRLGWSSLVGK
jgi:SWI/SNF-related matrix-associated actin-dependent regulator of chromatin subfamily A member 5